MQFIQALSSAKSWIGTFWIDPMPRSEKVLGLLDRPAAIIHERKPLHTAAMTPGEKLGIELNLWRRSPTSAKDALKLGGHLDSYARGTNSHERTTSSILDISRGPGFGASWNSSLFFLASKSLQQLGLFAGSSELYIKGLEALKREMKYSDNPRRTIGLLKLAIHEGDVEQSMALANSIRGFRPRSILVTLLVEYVDLWSRRAPHGFLSKGSEENSAFSSLVQGRPCLVFGPGHFSEYSEDDFRDFLVARVVFLGKLGITSLGSSEKKTHLAYINGINSKRLAASDDRIVEDFLSRFGAHVYRQGVGGDVLASKANIARAMPPNPSVLSGSTNMGVSMIVDILSFQPSHLFVKGITFYLGSSGYREDEERSVYSDSHRPGLKSLGPAEFKQCNAIGGHNLVENRQLIKNLFNTGAIDGDELFRDALMLSDSDYLLALDRLYGKNRL